MEQLGKILIVDDNEDVLFALNLLLEPYAEKIKVAGNPRSYRIFHDDIPAGHYPAGYELQSRRHQWAGRL